MASLVETDTFETSRIIAQPDATLRRRSKRTKQPARTCSGSFHEASRPRLPARESSRFATSRTSPRCFTMSRTRSASAPTISHTRTHREDRFRRRPADAPFVVTPSPSKGPAGPRTSISPRDIVTNHPASVPAPGQTRTRRSLDAQPSSSPPTRKTVVTTPVVRRHAEFFVAGGPGVSCERTRGRADAPGGFAAPHESRGGADRLAQPSLGSSSRCGYVRVRYVSYFYVADPDTRSSMCGSQLQHRS